MLPELIEKPVRRDLPAPNLTRYDAARRDFSWDAARTSLAGLPGGAINMAHEAVGRHAAGPRADHLALRWLGRSARLAAGTTGHVFAMPILNHYEQTLQEIHRAGFLHYWIEEFRPYIRGALEQFSPEHGSLTQRFLQRHAKKREETNG